MQTASQSKPFYLITGKYDPLIYSHRDLVIRAIAFDHASGIEAVYHITPDENSCRTVTEDIAREVAEFLQNDERRAGQELSEWIDCETYISVYQPGLWNAICPEHHMERA